MSKKIIIAIFSVLAIGSFLFFLQKHPSPYKGEYIAFKGVYHKTNCDLIKFSIDLELIFYPNYQTAIEANNRPCQSCKPSWYTQEELKRVRLAKAEQKRKEELIKKAKKLVEDRLEERKLAILKGQKKDLTDVEKEWKENALIQKHNRNPQIQKAIDEIVGNSSINSDGKLHFALPDHYIDGQLQKQIEIEVKKELKIK
jgi:quinol monooxygenase YgiN